MKIWRVILCILGAGLAMARLGADDLLDRLEQSLMASAFQAELRARLSGTLDLEQYRVQLPAPGLIQGTNRDLFNPRLTLFLDAQFGSKLYVFAQARADRGFDPGYGET